MISDVGLPMVALAQRPIAQLQTQNFVLMDEWVQWPESESPDFGTVEEETPGADPSQPSQPQEDASGCQF